MPFDRPTLPRLVDQGAAELEVRLPGVLARTRRSLIGVINRVMAGGLSALYQYAEWLNRQVWPDQAEAEYLVDHGARWGVPRTPAAPATGSVTFSGANGSIVPLGTVLQRPDGWRYLTDADVVIAAGVAVITVTAEEPGQDSNAANGQALQLASPIAGVNSAAAASTALAGGADIEDVEAWRARILERIRQVPQGGSADDYLAWAKEVPGVSRVWLFPGESAPGSVTVRFARDDDASPIPDAGEVAALQAHLEVKRPVTATVYVVAPVAAPLDFTLQITPDTPAIRAAVEAELRDVIRRDGAPAGTLYLTRLQEAISIAAGEERHVLTAPAADVTHTTNQLPVMGVITWLP